MPSEVCKPLRIAKVLMYDSRRDVRSWAVDNMKNNLQLITEKYLHKSI